MTFKPTCMSTWKRIVWKHLGESNKEKITLIFLSFYMNSQVLSAAVPLKPWREGTGIPGKGRDVSTGMRAFEWEEMHPIDRSQRKRGEQSEERADGGRVDEEFAKRKQVRRASQLSNKWRHTHFLSSPSVRPLCCHCMCARWRKKRAMKIRAQSN